MSTERRPDPERLLPAVGAAIFASDEPVAPQELARAFGVEVAEVDEAIGALQEHLERGPTGLRLERIAGGFRLSTRSDVGAWVRQYMRQRNRTRLSPAAMETLAVVAYRQPVTAPEIQAIRGKDPTAALRTLLDKKLVRLMGKKKVVGSPLLYGTSREFLLHFGLDSLGDLPSIDEFDRLLAGIGLETAGTTEESPHPAEAEEQDGGGGDAGEEHVEERAPGGDA